MQNLDLKIFQGLADIAEREAYDLQPWPNYYRLRAKEMESLFSLYRTRSNGRVLDIGSGIGFNAFMLDRFYDKTLAVDLYESNPKTHSLGIKRGEGFLDSVPYKNIRLIPASCENLPFGRDFFDAIYMIYTLEHIKNRRAALKEVRRVLKRDGEVIIIVPGFLERMFYPLSFYRDFLKKMLSYFALTKKKEKSNQNRRGDTYALPSDSKIRSFGERFFKAFPHFPFPDPHGEYPDYFIELIASISLVWVRLMKRCGFKIRRIFTTMLFPKEFSSLIVGERALDLYIKTLWINEKFGRNRLLRHLGQNLCLVLEKENV